MNLIEAKKILLAADLDPLVREALNVLSPDLDFQNLPGEEWRDVATEAVDFKDTYQVSTYGRIISFYNGKIRFLKLVDVGGYLHVELKNNGKSQRFKVHRLVAGAFIPNPEGKPYVNHIDGNKQNNCVENLAWATPSENIQHAYDTGLRKGSNKNFQPTLLTEQVREIRQHCVPGDPEFGFHAFARKFKSEAAAIRSAFYRRSYKSVE